MSMKSDRNSQTVETAIMTTLTEADVEAAALKWLAVFGRQTARGPVIAPDMPGGSGITTDQLVLERRLTSAVLPELGPGK